MINMGYVKHNVITFIHFDKEAIELVKKYADVLFNELAPVSDMMISGVNGDYMFFVGSDGSKVGWDIEIESNKARDEIVKWIKDNRSETITYTTVIWAYKGEDKKDYGVHKI